MIGAARQTIARADSGKVGARSFCAICQIERVDVIITGDDMTPAKPADMGLDTVPWTTVGRHRGGAEGTAP